MKSTRDNLLTTGQAAGTTSARVLEMPKNAGQAGKQRSKLTPRLRSWIDRVIIPALVDRYHREHPEDGEAGLSSRP